MESINNISLIIDMLNQNNKHLTDNFETGKPPFDFYIKKEAMLDKDGGKGVTYLIVDDVNGKIVAYFTLRSNSLPYNDIQEVDNERDEKLCGFSAIEIMMFAVNKEYQKTLYQGKLISDLVIQYIITFIYDMSHTVLGIQIILLNSVPDAIGFYKRNNFLLLEEYMVPLYDVTVDDDCEAMYLRIH